MLLLFLALLCVVILIIINYMKKVDSAMALKKCVRWRNPIESVLYI